MIEFRPDDTAETRLATIAREATAEARAPLVVAVAGACLRAARRRVVAGIYPLDLAYLDACMQAVQGVRYTPDPPDRDVYRSPVETFLGGGDCEDLSGLLFALVLCGRELLRLDVWAQLVWVVQRGAAQDHVSVWVARRVLAPWRVIADAETPTRGAGWAEVSVRAARGESPYAAVARIGRGHARIAGGRGA